MAQRLFIDFDGTIANSVKAYCDTYNYMYKNHSKFVKADWTKVNEWNFSDQCPLTTYYVEHIFKTKFFFSKLELFPDAKDVLRELCSKYEVTICTIGTATNISHKTLWINENLPFIKNLLFISNRNSIPTKEIVNMKNSIIIDDASKNLYSSNAKHKYCYGEVKKWNEDWKGDRLANWQEIKSKLLNI